MAIHEERIVETRPVIEKRSGGGSNAFLYFIVGALVVGMAVLGYMYFSNQQSDSTAIERGAAAVGDAAERIGDSVEDATRVPPQAPAPAPAEPAPQPN